MPGLPEIFDMSNPEGSRAGIAAAETALRRAALVGMPTETVYGLAADATSGEAVAAIYSAKTRPRFNPLIIHTFSIETAERIGRLPALGRSLAEAFWPGPLTIVVPREPATAVADLAMAGLDTVAVRVPAHPAARALIAAFDRPIAAPSANRSGHVSPTTAAHVAADLRDRVAVILDAGPTGIGLESTIVGLIDDVPRLLRSGGVARGEIEEVIGRALASPAGAEGAPVAPGMLRSHYAPTARVRLNVAEVRPGEALITFAGVRPGGADKAVATIDLSARGDLGEAAARLFAALRELDAKADAIAVAPIPETGLGEAINDRLSRAAAPRP